MWMIAAIFSAGFAGLTAILAKCGIQKTNSDLATALRTIVVLGFSILMVFIVGSHSTIFEISTKSWIFLVLSGLATGASWICYFKALAVGDVNKVAPIDKSSTVLSVLLAIILFGETNNLMVKLIGTVVIGVGTYLMIEKKDTDKEIQGSSWMIYAVLSAVFSALTSVLATGASWLCYYYAIQNGDLSVVVPIDKMSILLTVLFSRIFLKEKLTAKSLTGLCLMCIGTLAIACSF